MPFISRLAALTLLGVIAACSESPPPPATKADDKPIWNSADPSEDRKLADFFEQTFNDELQDSPIFQTQLGLKGEDYGEWDNFSDAHATIRNAQLRVDLDRLRNEHNYDRLSEKMQLSYRVWEFNAERDLANFEFRRHIFVAAHLDSAAMRLPVILRNQHKIDSLEDAEAYVSRLRASERALNQITRNLHEQGEMGILAPAFSLTYLQRDTRKLLEGYPLNESETPHALWQDFTAKLSELDASDADKEQLRNAAVEALRGPFARGYQTFLAELTEQTEFADSTDGVWRLPQGDAFYRARIRHWTTLDLEPEALHQTGLDEVARIHQEMAGIQRELGVEGSIQDFFEYIRSDPSNYYPNTDEGRQQFLDDAQAQIDEIYAVVDQYFNILPKAELVVRRVEPWREDTAGIAFYNRPSADGSRPGIYYANLKDMANVQKYVFTAITYHESAPGHHFQLALQQELTGLPRFRLYGGYGAYVEGWALYSEQLAREMGFYSDPLENAGRLQNELWRAVRLVVDTGLHHQRWNREQAIEYFRENTPLSEGDIVKEVERYISRPGQALAYKVGMMHILKLREQERARLGEAFDIAAFHDRVLREGSLPLELLN